MSVRLSAFILMPFDSSFDDAYRLGIKPALESAGFDATRVDEQIFHREHIVERIYSQIIKADLIVADMSGRNPNVFYEVGYAHAKDKYCILITNSVDDIPFDLRHRHHIVYNGSLIALHEQLSEHALVAYSELTEAKEGIPRLTIEGITGYLSKAKLYASASVEITVEISNPSKNKVVDIDHVYFHSGDGWRFTVNKIPVSSKASSISEFPIVHALPITARRLAPSGWERFTLSGEKFIAYGPKVELMGATYRLNGRAAFTIRSGENEYVTPVLLDVTIDDIPF